MEPILLRRGLPGDKQTVIDMIDEAAAWLHGMGTNPWASPWPDRDARGARVQQELDGRRTWIAEDADGPVGTITFRENANPRLWSALEQGERAVYLSRLALSRSAAQEIGPRMINWAVHSAWREQSHDTQPTHRHRATAGDTDTTAGLIVEGAAISRDALTSLARAAIRTENQPPSYWTTQTGRRKAAGSLPS